MKRIKDIVSDTNGHKRLAKLLGMSTNDIGFLNLYEKLKQKIDRNVPIDEEMILISCFDSRITMVGKRFMFFRTAVVESRKTNQKTESVEPAVLMNVYVPDFLLMVTRGGGRGNGRIIDGFVIRAARQQIVEESIYMEPYGFWMQLLYRPYDFSYLSGQLFRTNQPDAGRLQELHRKFKEAFAVNYLKNRPVAAEQEIVIDIKCRKEYPDVYVKDRGQNKGIDKYEAKDLLRMKVETFFGRPREELLVWILCYMLYPVRMRRLREIEVDDRIQNGNLL